MSKKVKNCLREGNRMFINPEQSNGISCEAVSMELTDHNLKNCAIIKLIRLNAQSGKMVDDGRLIKLSLNELSDEIQKIENEIINNLK